MQFKTILNRVEPYKSFVYGKVALLEDGDRRPAFSQGKIHEQAVGCLMDYAGRDGAQPRAW